MISALIIDDDLEFCDMLSDYLRSHEIALTAEHSVASGLTTASRQDFTLFLLDVMLPDGDGHEVLAEIRRVRPQARVLMLSAQGSEDDRITALDEGADDYLPKPFNPRELVSRIRAILRRTQQQVLTEDAEDRASLGLRVDADARRAFYRGKPLALTDVEFSLLHVFLNSPSRVLEREDLVTRVFQRPFNPMDRSLDVHISRLRRKLVTVGEFADPIRAIRSSGYLFTPPA